MDILLDYKDMDELNSFFNLLDNLTMEERRVLAIFIQGMVFSKHLDL